MTQTNKYAIIVAGGKGTRFHSDIPKQFHILGKLPILVYSVKKFEEVDPNMHIVLVLPIEYHKYWQKIQKEHNITANISLAPAGDSRFQSVKNGLDLIHDESALVAIHDGARPLVTERMIVDSYALAQAKGSAIPLVAVTDSIRSISDDGSSALDRNKLRAVQTPQTFKYEILHKAYEMPYKDIFTDDASVVEHSGEKIYTYNGDIKNIKITHPIDLFIAQYYIGHE